MVWYEIFKYFSNQKIMNKKKQFEDRIARDELLRDIYCNKSTDVNKTLKSLTPSFNCIPIYGINK